MCVLKSSRRLAWSTGSGRKRRACRNHVLWQSLSLREGDAQRPSLRWPHVWVRFPRLVFNVSRWWCFSACRARRRCWKCTSQRPSLHLCAGKKAKSMAARRYLGGSPGAAASSALPATWGSLKPTSSVTGASNAVVSARGSKRLDQPGVRRIATGSRGEARAWKA